MTKTCRHCDESFNPKKQRGRKADFCSSLCRKAYEAEYNARYCASDEWKRKRKEKRDARKLEEKMLNA